MTRHTRKINKPKEKRSKKHLKTYLSFFDQIKKPHYDRIFPGWKYRNLNQALHDKYVDLIYLDGWEMFSKKLWQIKSKYKSRISAPVLVNKFLLHKFLLDHQMPFTPETIFVSKKESPKILDLGKIDDKGRSNIWIWRTDTKEGGGKDVHVIDSKEKLLEVYRDFTKRNKDNQLNALLSRYITNPKLVEIDHQFYKFHLRIYLLVALYEDPKLNKAAVYKNGEIALSRKPYVNYDWYNSEIHDTHLSYRPPLRLPSQYPEGAKSYQSIFQQILKILTSILKKVLPTLSKYEETEVSFQLLGCDFMVDEDGKVWLIEINNSPAIDYDWKGVNRNNWLSDFLLRGVKEFVIDNKPDLKYLVNLKIN